LWLFCVRFRWYFFIIEAESVLLRLHHRGFFKISSHVDSPREDEDKRKLSEAENKIKGLSGEVMMMKNEVGTVSVAGCS
jgi:hypothetical protein